MPTIFSDIIQGLTIFWQLMPAITTAINTIKADTGQPIGTVISDVISHLTPGQANAPSLAPTATPAS